MLEKITWNGEQVTRTLTAYCSREAMTTRGSKFNPTPVFIPAEYAVKDQQGLIVQRFETMFDAEMYVSIYSA